MFGFQPMPMGGISRTLPTPPELPPINMLAPCDIELSWSANFPATLYLSPTIFYVYELQNYITPDFGAVIELYTGTLADGLSLDYRGQLKGTPSCSSLVGGPWDVSFSARWAYCPLMSPVISPTLSIYYYCTEASWTQDPIVINASTYQTININLANYVSNKICSQSYYYTDDGVFTQNDNLVETYFPYAGTWYGSATVSNNCQEFSANTVGFVFNIT